jgi:hypothetical protein
VHLKFCMKRHFLSDEEVSSQSRGHKKHTKKLVQLF